MKQLALFVFTLCFLCSQAQSPKYPVLSVPVQRYGSQLSMPWTGGMDSPEFSQIDLNGDGIMDLFVFDKVDNKVLTFLSNGTPGDTAYTYAPQYESLFPQGLYQWALLIDYNHDGIPDIFTHSTYQNNAGIAVYKGSIQDGHLQWNLVCPLIKYQSQGYDAPLFSNLNDIPVITDVNRDGALDILTYNAFGTNISLYENLEPQNPNNPAYVLDSFQYTLVTTCWGNVAQSNINNSMALNQSCKGGPPDDNDSSSYPDPRHSGNTIYSIIDPVYNDVDLLNGNIGYNNLILLRNCGDSAYANICEWDSLFPTCTAPMYIPTYPAAFGVDVNGDGLQDVLVAPNYPGVNFAGAGGLPGANINNVQYFENTGDMACWYSFQGDSFLVRHALDFGSDSKGLLYDFNGDGLLDLVVGGFGYFDPILGTEVSSLAYYQNTGTATHPVFTYVTNDVNHISQYNLRNVSPAFGDLNGDGKNDLIVGDLYGYLYYFQNVADTGSNFPSMTTTLYFGLKFGQYAAPFLFDVNGDSLNDLIVGDETGTLTYIPNTGTKTSAVFNQNNAIDTFGNINITPVNSTFGNSGFSSPYVTKDSAGNILLFVGSVDGMIYEYLLDPNNLAGAFTLLSSNFIGQSVGSMATISIGDINNDGKNEYLLGCGRGGMLMYSDSVWEPNDTITLFKTVADSTGRLNVYPNPTTPAHALICQLENARFINPSVEVYSLMGQNIRVPFTFANNQISITTSELSAGFYVVRIMSGGNWYTARFIIE